MDINNWQKGYAELRKEIAKLKKENLETKDELIKLRRTYEDQIDNLTLDNMPSVREVALKTEDGVAGVIVRLDNTNAQVQLIAERQTEQDKNIASIEGKADEAKAEVNVVAKAQAEQAESIASISQQADALGAEVIIAAERASAAENAASAAEDAASSASENVSNGAYIIARINEDGSMIKISADKLELSGYATFAGLNTPGKSVIDGANLKTGTVVADRIALNANGQIDFSNLGTLSFSDASGASGEMRLFENEYGKGEISLNADGTVAVSGGGASLALIDSGGARTEASVYADIFRMNGMQGITGDYSIGGATVFVENGIIVAIIGASGGDGGGETPVVLEAPAVYVFAECMYSFSIHNANGKGTIYYQTYWYDDVGNSWESEVFTDDSYIIAGDFSEFPPSGGYVGVRAWVEYDGHVSPTASAEEGYA